MANLSDIIERNWALFSSGSDNFFCRKSMVRGPSSARSQDNSFSKAVIESFCTRHTSRLGPKTLSSVPCLCGKPPGSRCRSSFAGVSSFNPLAANDSKMRHLHPPQVLVWRRQPPERKVRASGDIPIRELSQRNAINCAKSVVKVMQHAMNIIINFLPVL